MSELAEKIQKVTAEEIKKLAKQIIKDSNLNMAIVGNIKNIEGLKKAFHFNLF